MCYVGNVQSHSGAGSEGLCNIEFKVLLNWNENNALELQQQAQIISCRCALTLLFLLALVYFRGRWGSRRTTDRGHIILPEKVIYL